MGLIFSVALTVIAMYEVQKEEAKLMREVAQSQESHIQIDDLQVKARKNAIQKKKVDNILNLLKNLGDMVTASQGVGLPKQLFGFDFNDGQVGCGGFLSAVITCYQLYPASKK